MVLFSVVFAAREVDEIFGQIHVVAVVWIRFRYVPIRIHESLDKGLTDPTNSHISAKLLELLCQDIKGFSFVPRSNRRQSERSAVLGLENYQE